MLVAFFEKWCQSNFFSSTFLPPMLMQKTSVPRRGKGINAKPKSKKISSDDCFNQPNFHFRPAYKYCVFFKHLSPNVPLAWHKAMPDVVVRAKKESYKNNEECECGDLETNTNGYTQVGNFHFLKHRAASVNSKNVHKMKLHFRKRRGKRTLPH